jgi:hypothetical protein
MHKDLTLASYIVFFLKEAHVEKGIKTSLTIPVLFVITFVISFKVEKPDKV